MCVVTSLSQRDESPAPALLKGTVGAILGAVWIDSNRDVPTVHHHAATKVSRTRVPPIVQMSANMDPLDWCEKVIVFFIKEPHLTKVFLVEYT